MATKISSLQIENVKRVKAVTIEPTQDGLTIIGGNNGQGKTSILDSIAWALGGNKMKPSKAERKGSHVPPKINLTMSNGLKITREGKNSTLKVIDLNGNKQGQALLDTFISTFALNLPKFMNYNNKEKADVLLQIIGVGEQLAKLELEEQKIYDDRRVIGQIGDQKKKYAQEQIFYEDVPNELISVSELLQQQQDILVKNGENERKRQNLKQLENNHSILLQQLQELQNKIQISQADLEVARKSAVDLLDESTEELESNIANIEKINTKIRANMDKEQAEEEAKKYKEQYDAKTLELDKVRKKKEDLLKNANLPLEGLSVQEGNLVYNGHQWDNMSGSEQLIVATSIVRKLNPECGFVLLDKLEQMDLNTLNEFNKWLVQEGLQVIATRVSTGEECSIIIEDGYAIEQQSQSKVEPQNTSWKVGEF